MNEPVLKTKVYTEGGTTYRMTVHGGLHYIRGNKAPYFSLTADVDRKDGRGRWVEDSGGCQHALILKHYPSLKPLADLHLSHIDGSPSYAKDNGWYWLAGALGGAGERYHGGNSERQHWKGEYPQEFDGYRFSTPDECLQTLAEHVRIPIEEARVLRDSQPTKASFAAWCETQRPRWKQEADACIASLGLVVFGDHWEDGSHEQA